MNNQIGYSNVIQLIAISNRLMKLVII